MINNAGLMPQALLELLKVDEWDQMINVNIKGVRHRRGAAANEGAKIKTLYQRVARGRTQGWSRLCRLRGDEARCAGAV